ncbi:unnamed protein product [Enterobius vermicularis]|uniref:Secreted protein n=1 Tax=Enterobius vermicularis TaxID=51028 RepID=A0A0N4UWJ1_ENTVE|nr:unnamed protein product [Enterobius vermicularis]
MTSRGRNGSDLFYAVTVVLFCSSFADDSDYSNSYDDDDGGDNNGTATAGYSAAVAADTTSDANDYSKVWYKEQC